MARWEPNAGGRLQEAALELFAERGYEGTTVEDIATRAGVTKRTFFRHFADKREVLFPGDAFQVFVLDALAETPADAPPLEALASTFDAVGESFRERRAFSSRRWAVIAASAELRERELVKLADLTAALAAALRDRGIAEPAATLSAETAMVAFRTAFDRWASHDDGRDLGPLIREDLAALRAVWG